MDETKKQASHLLRKASDDLYAAVCLAKDPGVSLWTVGFHAQQAIEKAIKSVLMRYGIPYPFTHDIAALIKILRNANLPIPPDAEDLPYLTPFGTLFRYEDETWGLPKQPDAERFLTWAGATVDWARATIEGGPRDRNTTRI